MSNGFLLTKILLGIFYRKRSFHMTSVITSLITTLGAIIIAYITIYPQIKDDTTTRTNEVIDARVKQVSELNERTNNLEDKVNQLNNILPNLDLSNRCRQKVGGAALPSAYGAGSQVLCNAGEVLVGGACQVNIVNDAGSYSRFFKVGGRQGYECIIGATPSGHPQAGNNVTVTAMGMCCK